MKTIAQTQKEARKAPKFYLLAYNKSKDNYVYVSDTNITGADFQLTENFKSKQLFSIGFDDEAMKEKAWSLATGFEFMAIAV
jgi:heat shock protein HspQ